MAHFVYSLRNAGESSCKTFALFRNALRRNVSKIIITSQVAYSCLHWEWNWAQTTKFVLPSFLKHTDIEQKKVSTHCNLCLQNISSEVNENQVTLKGRKLLFSLTVICLFLFVPAIVFNFSCVDRNTQGKKQWLCKILGGKQSAL